MRHALLLLVPALLFADVVPGDGPYRIHKSESATLIFPENRAEISAKALARFEAIANRYDKSFNYQHNRTPFLTLASDRNQIANAWATAVPYPQMTLYGGGAQLIDYFNHTDWLATLLAHESAHLYQLDAKGGFSRVLERIFGHNSMPLFAGPVPLFTLPNLWTPDLLLEGSAVYNESRLAEGGRLYGGRHRALFLALLQADKLDATRLLNNHRGFPYLEEKYIIGGYFWAYLANRYGAEQVDSFFRRHADFFFYPLLIDASFKRHFGEGFYTLLHRFLDHYRDDAKQMQPAKGDRILTSQVYVPLGGDEEAVWIYTDDHRGHRAIHRLDRARHTLSKQTGYFLAGKPFCLEEGCFTAAAAQVDSGHIAPGLFGAKQRPLEGYTGQIVQDLQGENRLYFDAKESLVAPVLYRNDQHLGTVHASARFGPDGSVYTVRFEAGKRVFYRDEERLFGVSGPAMIADPLPDGGLLFIAPTSYGSGLFLWQRGDISRLGRADNILDARYLSGDRFVVASVTAEGYAYHITGFKLHDQRPVRYGYRFEEQTGPLAITESNRSLSDRGYYAPLSLSFSSLYPSVYMGPTSALHFSLTAHFIDPLHTNQLSLSYLHEETASAAMRYSNTRHRLFYGGTLFGDLNTTTATHERDWGAEAHVGFQLYRRPATRADLRLRRQFDPDDDRLNPTIASINYDRTYGAARLSQPLRSYGLALHGRTNDHPDRDRPDQAAAAALYLQNRLIGPSFARLALKGTQASEGSMVLIDKPGRFITDPTHILLRDPLHTYGAKNALSGRLNLKADIQTPLYFSRVPLGLHRVSPILSFQRVDFEWFGSKERYQIDEAVAALEAEMLFAHRFDFAIEAGVIKNSEQEKARGYFLLKAAY
jgi:hypothetical protein